MHECVRAWVYVYELSCNHACTSVVCMIVVMFGCLRVCVL